jgi:nitroreductase
MENHDRQIRFMGHMSLDCTNPVEAVPNIELPAPRTKNGKSLLEALALRRTQREFSARPLSPQLLSEVLWAASGINRPMNGGDTVPKWRNVRVIDIYLAMANGVWIYEPSTHSLRAYLAADIRSQSNLQEFASQAPLEIIYVARGALMRDMPAWDRRLYASVDAAFIGENVYLFCASESLATVFRGTVDHAQVGRTLQLSAEQFVVFAQTVGYPA